MNFEKRDIIFANFAAFQKKDFEKQALRHENKIV